MGKITVCSVEVQEHRILCDVAVEGDVLEALTGERFCFTWESPCSLQGLPESIAVIPLLGNLLPIAWVYDAVIECEECDSAFLESIADFKQGYMNMYPMLHFGGEMRAARAVNNGTKGNGSLAFYSGGVDSFDTAIRHLSEKPLLLTIWGADIPLDKPEEWHELVTQVERAARTLDTEYTTLSSNFRQIVRQGVLSRKVVLSGDGWWHGFQHGLGLICLAAPIAWEKGLSTIYIASSFTAADIGTVTCASDPTIDNYVRFCGVRVVHDGYDCDRQHKIRNIVEWCRATGKRTYIRVCWETKSSTNCCQCEKCWRTILGLYAEGEDPREYGFEYADPEEQIAEIHENAHKCLTNFPANYSPIITALREHFTEDTVRPDLKWLWRIDIANAGELFQWLRFRDRQNSERQKELESQLRAAQRGVQKVEKLEKENAKLRAKLDRLQGSYSYRIGRWLTWPVRKLQASGLWKRLKKGRPASHGSWDTGKTEQ